MSTDQTTRIRPRAVIAIAVLAALFTGAIGLLGGMLIDRNNMQPQLDAARNDNAYISGQYKAERQRADDYEDGILSANQTTIPVPTTIGPPARAPQETTTTTYPSKDGTGIYGNTPAYNPCESTESSLVQEPTPDNKVLCNTVTHQPYMPGEAIYPFDFVVNAEVCLNTNGHFPLLTGHISRLYDGIVEVTGDPIGGVLSTPSFNFNGTDGFTMYYLYCPYTGSTPNH